MSADAEAAAVAETGMSAGVVSASGVVGAVVAASVAAAVRVDDHGGAKEMASADSGLKAALALRWGTRGIVRPSAFLE